MNYITIDKQKNITQRGMMLYHYGDLDIYVDGLIFVYGKKAGKESIDWLAESIHNIGSIPFEELHGAFSCIIKDEDKITAFSDNSNMHCLYYSEDIISSRYLKIIQSELEEGKEPIFDLEAVCEYLTLGNIYFEKTFFHGIRILASTEIITIEDEHINVFRKPIADIDGQTQVTTINEYFDKVAYSLSEMRVCQALTGGYDSRMVYACLSNKIKDHPAISSNKTDDPDVIHAMEVARNNGSELDVISIQKPKWSIELLNKLLMYLDGIQAIDIESNIRLLAFKKHLAQNYDIHLTGDGGVLHKDWEWTQDFPLYRRKKSNAKKFYQQRLYFIKNNNHLGEKLKPVFLNQQARFENYLNHISKSLNTQSYDSWYYIVSGNRRVAYNNNVFDGFVSYAPLLEIDLVKFSYALPRFERFFYNSMRKTITKENIKIARVPTNYGTTASSEKRYIIRDCFYQTIEYVRKAIRVISRKFFNKTILNNNVLDWSLEQSVRESLTAKEAVEFAQKHEYINSTEIKELSYIELQRLIHIYWLAQYINEKQ